MTQQRHSTTGLSLWGRWLAVVLICQAAMGVKAGPEIDNNGGTWTDLYSDNLGLSAVDQTVLDTGAGVVRLVPGQATGSFTTVLIKPLSFDAWGRLQLDGIWSAPGDVTVTILDSSDAVILGPVGYSGPVDLSTISAAAYPELRVRVGLTEGQVSPAVTSLQATWHPVSLLLLDKGGPAQVLAGQLISYRIRYSVSFVGAKDLVVWDQLPSKAAGTLVYPQDFGQDDDPVFISATKGGAYTEVPITVKGVSIPARSVYWDLGNLPEGTSDTLLFTIRTMNGTLDGTVAQNRAQAGAFNAAGVSSGLTETRIQSVPAPVIEKRGGAGIYTLADGSYSRSGLVNYFNITARNTFAGEGRETMYQTVVYDDLTDLVGKIEPDLGGPGIPVIDISGGGTYVANYTPPGGGAPFPAVVWDVGAMGPGAVFNGSFGVKLLDSPPMPTE